MNKLDLELKFLEKLICECGLCGDLEFLKSVSNRKALQQTYPDAFLSTDKRGIPVFPTRGQFGSLSFSVLKKSLANANRLRNQTGDPKYDKIIELLANEIKKAKEKVSNKMQVYRVNSKIFSLLKNDKTRLEMTIENEEYIDLLQREINTRTEDMASSDNLEDVVLNEKEYQDFLEEGLDFKLVKKSLGISLIFFLVKLLLFVGSTFLSVVGRTLDKTMTKKMRTILNDPEVKVFTVKGIPNAFTSIDRSIYYTNEILSKTKFTEQELIAVLCHEYGHRYYKHASKTWTTVLGGGFLIDSLVMYISVTLAAVELAIYIALIFETIFLTTYTRTIARKHEYIADSYASKMGYSKELISGLKKLTSYSKKLICKGLNAKKCKKLLKRLDKDDPHPVLKDRITNIARVAGEEMKKSKGKIQQGKVLVRTSMALRKELKHSKE